MAWASGSNWPTPAPLWRAFTTEPWHVLRRALTRDLDLTLSRNVPVYPRISPAARNVGRQVGLRRQREKDRGPVQRELKKIREGRGRRGQSGFAGSVWLTYWRSRR